MECYTSDLRKIEYNFDYDCISKGTQGKIYRLDDDKCIKIYDKDVTRFNPEVFRLLKELSLDDVYKLYELLYSDNNLETVVAYTMKYYLAEVDNILDMPIDYTLDNIDMLHRVAKDLADYRILLKDRIPQNVILGNDMMTMIDLDSCIIDTRMNRDGVLDINTSNLLYMFKRLYEEGLKKKGVNIENNAGLDNYLDGLFGFTREPAKVLLRRMCGAKTPMDLLYWRY